MSGRSSSFAAAERDEARLEDATADLMGESLETVREYLFGQDGDRFDRLVNKVLDEAHQRSLAGEEFGPFDTAQNLWDECLGIDDNEFAHLVRIAADEWLKS